MEPAEALAVMSHPRDDSCSVTDSPRSDTTIRYPVPQVARAVDRPTSFQGFSMLRRLVLSLLMSIAMLPTGCGALSYTEGPGATGLPGRRLYMHDDVRDEWVGATWAEVQEVWGEPHCRFYWDEDINTRPTAAFVEVCRHPYRRSPGQAEEIFFILSEDYSRVIDVRFGEPLDWNGGDVEVDIYHDW
jgi:hypothetical protein